MLANLCHPVHNCEMHAECIWKTPSQFLILMFFIQFPGNVQPLYKPWNVRFVGLTQRISNCLRLCIKKILNKWLVLRAITSTYIVILFVQGNHFSYTTGTIQTLFVIKSRPQHQELHALLYANSVWVLLRPTELWTLKGCETGPIVYHHYLRKLQNLTRCHYKSSTFSSVI